MRNFVYQGDEESCGLASLKMLLLDLTKKKGYRYLKVDASQPLSLEEIRKIAWKEGVHIEWKKALTKESILNCDSFPMLVMLEGENRGHLVYLKKGTKKKVLVFDPATGPKWYKREDLAERFSLIYGEVFLDSVNKCSYRKPKIVSMWSVVLPSLMSFIGIGFLFAALYLIGNEDTQIAAGISLGMYGLFMILSRFLGSIFSKSFDKRWLKYVPSSDKKRLAKNYERYYAYKSTTLPAFTILLESICSVFGLVFLFGFNEPLFCLASIALTIYLFVESQAFRKKSEKEKIDLGLEEESLFSSIKPKKEQIKMIKDINTKANKIGEKSTYARIIYVAVVAALSAITPLFSENISLNFYLFQFFALIGLGQAIRSLLYFFETRVARERAYVYFCDNFANKESARY